MATKKNAGLPEFTQELRSAVIATMLELAFRNAEAESLMMRVANAGEFTEVTQEIKRRRLYGKKMGLVRSTDNSAGEDEPEQNATPRKKRSSKRKQQSAEGEGSDTK